MRRWRRQGPRPHDDTVDAAEAAGGQAGPLTLLGGIIGGIFGWLMSSGALPHPASLPIPAGEPLRPTLVLGALGALLAGALGLLADWAEGGDRREAETMTPSQTDQR